MAVLVHIVAGAVIVCIAGALRSMAGYDLPSLDAVLGAIPAWKYFIGIYLVALAAVSLRYRGELSEWPVGPVALLLAWPFLVPAALIDLRAYKEDI